LGIAIAGAGGHGRVVAETLLALGMSNIAGFLDDDPGVLGCEFGMLRVLGTISSWKEHGVESIVLGIGHNRARLETLNRLVAMGADVSTVIHPRAIISPSAEISNTAIILAAAVVNVGARIGRNALVNTAAIVEHDCIVADHAHLAPRCCIGGAVVVGEGSLLGIGSTVLPGRKIGNWCVVGAGAVVTQDVPDGAVVAGIPARSIK
jgi:sugar O-acyltransferase (sialic acid O-acetyltransferase NeuD family)